jgi:hypothetical protein
MKKQFLKGAAAVPPLGMAFTDCDSSAGGNGDEAAGSDVNNRVQA